MSAKRFLITFALAALLATTGCRTWCERHYPCPAPAPCCVPCTPTASYSAPAAPPPQNWTAPVAAGGGGRCRCIPVVD